MVRRLATAVLIVVGLSLIAMGVQRWFDQHAAKEVVLSFMRAVAEGDEQTALSLLNPRRRAEVEKHGEAGKPLFQTPDPGLKFRVHHVEIDGTEALVQLWIEKQGFVVKPIVHLERSETTRWKISRIEQLDVDPKWVDLQNDRAHDEGELIAKELAEALKNRPGVTVQRGALNKVNRPTPRESAQ